MRAMAAFIEIAARSRAGNTKEAMPSATTFIQAAGSVQLNG